MDLSVLKQKLDTLQAKPQQGQKTDYTTIFWRPTIGKQQIRVVPSVYDAANPFTELGFYYGITNKVMISPLNFDEPDPIAQFAAKLREGEYDKENYVLAKKLDAKNRIFIPVVVRGEEDKGVRLWQFGKQIFEDFLSMAADDEIGDFTDIVNGRDFTLETVGPESTGTPYNKTSVRPRMKTSPLSDDTAQVELWLGTQPNPREVFKKWTFDQMKDALAKWLSPEEDTTEEATSFPTTSNIDSTDRQDLPWEKNGAENSNFKLDTNSESVKVKKEDQFDKLFS